MKWNTDERLYDYANKCKAQVNLMVVDGTSVSMDFILDA